MLSSGSAQCYAAFILKRGADYLTRDRKVFSREVDCCLHIKTFAGIDHDWEKPSTAPKIGWDTRVNQWNKCIVSCIFLFTHARSRSKNNRLAICPKIQMLGNINGCVAKIFKWQTNWSRSYCFKHSLQRFRWWTPPEIHYPLGWFLWLVLYESCLWLQSRAMFSLPC